MPHQRRNPPFARPDVKPILPTNFDGPRSPPADEVRSLTGLRAILAWWVVAFHFARHHVPDEWALLKATVAGGHVAVDVFFVLSGYVLMRRYGEARFTAGATLEFYSRRFARIYPLYLVSLVIGAAASSRRFFEDCGSSTGLTRLTLEVLLLNAWTHLAMFLYNFAAWSLSVEVFFYLLGPWLLPAVGRRPPRALVAFLGLAWMATFVAPLAYTTFDPDHLGRALALGDEVKWSWYLKFFPLQRLPEFVAGAAAARLNWHPRRAAPLAAVALWAILASGQVPYAFLVAGVLMPLIVLLVVGVAAYDRGLLASGACVALGRASYATYILHWPLFLAWSRFDPDVWERPAHVLMFCASLLVISLLAFRLVEEPLRRRLTRRLGRERLAVAPIEN
jgi:peptidoglycan/LPS O-acetylase OafA/YrhL